MTGKDATGATRVTGTGNTESGPAGSRGRGGGLHPAGGEGGAHGAHGSHAWDGGSPSPERALHTDHSHRDVNGGWLRPAVFGAMDGLVSNLGLMSGVAGSNASSQTIVISGLAGLAAGAFSMAAGEYTSVASQRELVEAELDVERRELRRHPEEELQELADVYVARGVEPELAAEVARQLHHDPEQALEIHAREELGVDPSDLPSPTVAAVSSFLSFSAGAIIPVLPYLVGASALWPAVVLALLGLFVCGMVVARVTARPWWFSGLRQLTLGGAAAAVTYGLGTMFGVAVG